MSNQLLTRPADTPAETAAQAPAVGLINPLRLSEYATAYRLGKYEIFAQAGELPIYVERNSGGWVVRAEHPGSMCPYYLNSYDPPWRYKRGTSFGTPEAAVTCFNDFLRATGATK